MKTASLKKTVLTSFLSLSIFSPTSAGVLTGTIKDKVTQEPLIGVPIIAVGTNYGAITDVDGIFELSIPDRKYDFSIKYIGYNDTIISNRKIDGRIVVNIELTPLANELAEVTVTARQRFDSEIVQVEQQRQSLVVQTGVSAQQIARTQDKDASEVIRRVPGVSIIDDKFVMVRGLSQRYNNVWLNGSAVPSSEADSRAFSFDILPSSQLDNIVIVKSPAPEYPADFTGGFVLVNTKQQPTRTGLDISLGAGYNSNTHFRRFLSSKGGRMDFLGFDDGFRSLDAGMKGSLKSYDGMPGKLNLLNNGLNNDWTIKNSHPLADIKLNASYNDIWRFDDGQSIGLLAALNYNNAYRTFYDMENSLYGPYDTTNDKLVFLRKATDNQYNHDIRLGVLLNLFFQPLNMNHLFEWKNIFNQIGKNRYSERSGYNAQPDRIEDFEYYFSSRTTYNTQFTGKHEFDRNHIDWSVGYAYANRNMPDRRLIQRTDRTEQRMSIYRIGREFSKLDEHIGSFSVNYKKDFLFGKFAPTLKAGIYGEYRTRTYRTRQFQYGWEPDNNLPSGLLFSDDIPGSVLTDGNYGPDKLYLYEEVNYLNNYEGSLRQSAGYLGVNLPWNNLNVYAGIRYENCRQSLKLNTRQYEESLNTTNYDYNDFFPSVNIAYKLPHSQQLRAAYGRSVNRPEFRELSPSVFYDFDLGSNVMGNYDLKAAYIDNVDLRYEWYPSKGEQVSLALFYKHFKNPIEWTYTVAGGTDLIYSFINALGADNYGVELDIRKNLDFIGLKDFSFSFNGAFIKSSVRFAPGTNDIDRPMQGQSPYLINTGLFYNNTEKGWSAAILYNRIGKRIIGVGNRYGIAADGSAKNIPNSYEMPRNNLDISLGKKLGRWEIKATVRDLLGEKYLFQQFEKINKDGKEQTISEVTRSYKPGINISITVSYSF